MPDDAAPPVDDWAEFDQALTDAGIPNPKRAPTPRRPAESAAEPPKTPAAPNHPGRLVKPAVDPDQARAVAYAQEALRAELETLASAAQGERNDTLNRAAFNLGQLVGSSLLGEREVTYSLLDCALSIGLGELEATKTIASGLSNGVQHPRGVPARIVEVGTGDQTPMADEAIRDATDDPDFWQSREWLALVKDYATARRTAPWAVLGVVLARVVAAIPPFVVLPALAGSEASLNQFVALVGPSGAGKGAALGVGRDIMTHHVDVLGAGSGEGLGHLYVRRGKQGQEQVRQAVILTVEEIDTLTALNERRGSTLLPELRKAWSGESLGFAYADPTKALIVASHSYRLALIAGVQPGRAAGLFGEEDAGTPQRFIWLPATDPHAPDVVPELPELPRWTRPRDMPMADHRTHHVALGVCETARVTIDAQRLAGLRGEQDALDGHALLARLKVGAALALLDGRLGVSDEDWELAGAVMAVSDATRNMIQRELRRGAEKRAAGAGFAEAVKADMIASETERRALARLFDWVPKMLAGGALTRADLRRAAASRDRVYLDAAIAMLVNTEKIKAIEIPGSSQSGVRYEVA